MHADNILICQRVRRVPADHHTICSKYVVFFLSELCIFRDMSPFGMHRGAAVKKSIGVGRSTSRNPLGLEDLHRTKCV